ncbi:hypothetical protein Back11_31900 [Paenibacillus baekrokdamisoli]|uniref:Uncharacterized protein n=1 Tax=Paenibacillus baekrokdamisoli TaxID=1712516 RepID=A0A3G9J0G8_9BACL|nr:sugar transferase [Paenibacillus baekrokdamisoli]MBB3071645.1 lipopolysaccharide/colanic/teichoic acid biosynthesis glycosyltransferase [Paenibacillus baekrokdamisoli]BBH21845.1 hypothetical protein Back11_31900 [Paenibacillus baekrokdamisoli]
MKSVVPVTSQTKAQDKSSLYELYIKAVVDYLLALLIFIPALPFLVLVFFLIKWSSPGTPIFRQPRVGKNGKPFTIYKFRTMYIDVPKEGHSPTSGSDRRITPLGRLLRKTSIDELPQLINILRGEMSFIGPRPEQKSIVDTCYTEYEKQRFCVKPGLTGLWQISEDRTKPIHHNLQHDFEYINHLSVVMDLSILYRTLRVIVRSNTH